MILQKIIVEPRGMYRHVDALRRCKCVEVDDNPSYVTLRLLNDATAAELLRVSLDKPRVQELLAYFIEWLKASKPAPERGHA